MDAVSICTYDANTSKVITNHFYNICLTEGEYGATAIENNFHFDNGYTFSK